MSSNLKLLLVVPAILLFLSGCITQREITEDIQDTHQEAYRDWKRQEKIAVDSMEDEEQLTVHDTSKTQTQPVISGQLSLEDALKLAILYNRDLERTVEEKNMAEGRVLSAYGNVTPSVSVNGTYRRVEDVNAFEVGDQRISLGALNNYTVNLSVQQPLFDGGSLGAGLRAAKYYAALTDENIKAQAEQTIYQTQSLYLQTLLLQEQYTVSRERVELSEAALNDVQNQQKFGTASEYNVLRAEVDLANARTQMINMKNRLEQTLSQLFITMGVSQQSNVTINDSLSYQPVDWSEEKAVQMALLNRPDLAGSKLSVDLQEESVKSSYSDYFPTVSAYFDNTWGRPNPTVQTLDEWGRIWNAGITLNWSLFNLNREGQIKQQKSALRQQKINYLNLREQVLFEVHSSMLALENAREAVEAQELTLDQAREGLRLAEVQFREGTIGQVALLDAQQSLTEAQFNYFSSIHDHALAKLDLNRATGQLRLEVSDEVTEPVPVLQQNN